MSKFRLTTSTKQHNAVYVGTKQSHQARCQEIDKGFMIADRRQITPIAENLLGDNNGILVSKSFRFPTMSRLPTTVFNA